MANAEPKGFDAGFGDRGERGVVVEAIRRDLSSILDILERRFLFLVKEGGREAISPDVIADELSLLVRDLKAGFRRLVDVDERRDLSYQSAKDLAELGQHSLWLFRRMLLHQISLRKLVIEARLRTLVSPEAFTIYETLLALDDDERDIAGRDEAALRALALRDQESTGTLPSGSD